MVQYTVCMSRRVRMINSSLAQNQKLSSPWNFVRWVYQSLLRKMTWAESECSFHSYQCMCFFVFLYFEKFWLQLVSICVSFKSNLSLYFFIPKVFVWPSSQLNRREWSLGIINNQEVRKWCHGKEEQEAPVKHFRSQSQGSRSLCIGTVFTHAYLLCAVIQSKCFSMYCRDDKKGHSCLSKQIFFHIILLYSS